jgi:hypothetical protein
LALPGCFPLAHDAYASGDIGPAEQATDARLRHFKLCGDGALGVASADAFNEHIDIGVG